MSNTVVLSGKSEYEFSIDFTLKWSVQMCRPVAFIQSVTVTERAVVNVAMKISVTQ
jgi:hypothetical protein